MEHILIIEDEAVIRKALAKLLKRAGYKVSEAGSVAESEKQYSLDTFHLIIADLRLPGGLGTEVIEKCAGTPVLIMTSYASIGSAVDAMKAGAADYISKPFNHDEILVVIDRLIRQNLLFRQNQALRRDIQREYPTGGIIGSSPGIQQVLSIIHKVAATRSTALICGESGTGKELVARAIHDQGDRQDAPLVVMNCAAIPDSLIESELFGYEKGAFTGADKSTPGLIESADGGTLFLDEVAELSPPAQAGLLRVIQEGELRRLGSNRTKTVDVRILAATHRNLAQRVKEGLFREDLMYRLRVVEIDLPALRERREDIPALAEHLLQRISLKLNRRSLSFSSNALQKIQDHDWPGNVRELENAIERAVILADGDTLDAHRLTFTVSTSGDSDSQATPSSAASLDDYFVEFVRKNEPLLNETELAKQLGISRKTLWERRQKFGIPRGQSSSSSRR